MMAIKFLKIAAIYFLIGMLLGTYMLMSHQLQYAPSHTHINLLGWASLALAGIIYHLFPIAAESKLTKVHFWLQNIGLLITIFSLIILENGYMIVEPIIITIGAALTSLGVLLFVINVLVNVKSTVIHNDTSNPSIQG